MRQVFEKVFTAREHVLSIRNNNYMVNIAVVFDQSITTIWIGFYCGHITLSLPDIYTKPAVIETVEHALLCCDTMLGDGFCQYVEAHARAIVSYTSTINKTITETDHLIALGKTFGWPDVPLDIDKRARKTIDYYLEKVNHKFNPIFNHDDVNTLFYKIDDIFMTYTNLDCPALVQ